MRLRDANGVIAPNGLLNAIHQAQQMNYDANAWSGASKPKTGGIRPLVADLNTNNWEWLGPGNIGGRIRSLVIHPTIPSTIWVGGVSGGVWKSTNSGASWLPLNDWMASLAISCMEIDKTSPNVLYAGTGSRFRGAGIFKSSDGGSTWAQLTNTSYAVQGNINRLTICPTNHLILLAGTANGIFRSADAGTTWTQTYNTTSIRQVAFSPTNGSKAIAGADDGGIALYSTDVGQTWTAASGLGVGGRVEFAYAPSNPQIVYVQQDVGDGTIYASTDGGVTYTQRGTNGYNAGGQMFNASCVWVDPTNPNIFVVGGLDLWRSTNGGTNLTKISDWIANQNAQRNDQFSSVHADHQIIVSPPSYDGVSNLTVYFGGDGGIVRNTNIYTATTTNGWVGLDNNLGITEFYGGAGNPTTFTAIGGSQDNGTPRYTTQGGPQNWHLTFGGDGGYCAADPTNPSFFYGEYVKLQIFRSTDGAQSADYIFGGIGDAGIASGFDPDDTNAPTSANFIAPFIIDPNNPNTLLGGGSNLWRTVNAKTPIATNVSWSIIKAGVTSGSFISAIAVSQGNSDVVWAGHNDGEIYSTANGTAANPTWTRKDLNPPGLPSSMCQSIAIDPVNSNIVYVSFGGYATNNLYRTADGGATWTNIGSTLPAAPINTIAIAPFNHNFIYVGTQVGIFGSANAGINWSPANEGPANVNTDGLFWLRNYLYAATYGRGMYRIALGPPTVVVTPSIATAYVGSNVTFTASAIGTPTLNYQWQYDGNNIAGANGSTLLLTGVQATNDGLYRVIVSNGEGVVTSSVAPLTVILSPPYRSQSLSTSPLAYWRLNEASGVTAFDETRNYNGTDLGSLVLGIIGPVAPAFPGFEPNNTAYQFDGTTASVSVPPLNLNTNTITVTAWVNCNGIEANRAGIFFWRDTPGNGWGLRFDAANNLGYTWNGSVYDSTLHVPTNQWTFVAMVVTASNTVFYMATNSTLQSFINNAPNINAAFNTTAYIGRDSGFASRYFNGAIDEVALYNQSLTQTQIMGLVSASQTSLPVVTLTAPADGSSLPAAPINLTASVATNGHTIQKVQFYNSATLLGEAVTPPYQYNWSGPTTSGTYTLFAQVLYDGSATLSSLPANITVTNSSITVTGRVTGISHPTTNSVTLSFVGTAGHAFDVQRSTNLLSSWLVIGTTNAPIGGAFSFTDNFSSFGGVPPRAAFYRLSWAP